MNIRYRASLFCLLLYSPLTLSQTPQITIAGAEAELERNIRAHVVLPVIPCDASLRRLNRFLPEVRSGITRAARALGFYFLTEESTFTAGEPCWQLSIAVVPGEPVVINDVRIDILGDQGFARELLSDLPLRQGEPLNHGAYEQIKSSLSAAAIENGYFDARFNRSQLLLDLQQGQADIDIEFAPQARYRFGAVEIQSLDALSDDFINRFIEIAPDEPYSSTALLNLRNALSDSLYFSNVSVTPALDRAQDQHIPIQVALQPRPRRVYGAGMGVTTDIGPRVRLDYEDRYVNRRGHHLEAQAAASPVQQLLDLDYTIPMRKPATESLRLSVGTVQEDLDTYRTLTSKIGVSYGHINPFNFQQNYFVNYQRDDYRIKTSGPDTNDSSDLLITGTNISRTRANDAIYPTVGWRMFAQIRGSSDSLFSSESFTQFYFSAKGVRQIGPGRLLVKLEAGASLIDEVNVLPASVQFFAGGDQSVRGYKYQSLGPRDEFGNVFGGKHMLTTGVEYDFNIRPSWKMAVFLDAGNAFDNWTDYRLQRGAGLGLRWLSPIGPVRMDLASALDDDRHWRLHITMGPDL